MVVGFFLICRDAEASLIIVVCRTSWSPICWSSSFCSIPAGRERVEYLPVGHCLGHRGARQRHHYWGCQHAILVLWYVEDHLCMAHRGHGSLQHQLLALWRAQVMVKTRARSRDCDTVFYKCVQSMSPLWGLLTSGKTHSLQKKKTDGKFAWQQLFGLTPLSCCGNLAETLKQHSVASMQCKT